MNDNGKMGWMDTVGQYLAQQRCAKLINNCDFIEEGKNLTWLVPGVHSVQAPFLLSSNDQRVPSVNRAWR
ncbi:hypothetical protein WNZ14_05825 [Hoeflea sp. AS60]|uniref:hypothetical protein n=1 Tax=Hoeflea sp. AS60 TaxID=3135780 RepID=UPI00317E0C78